MLGLLKTLDLSSIQRNEVIHSLHKVKSNTNLHLNFDRQRDQDNKNRCSIQSQPKTDGRKYIISRGYEKKDGIHYMSYPSIFQNKTSNIMKILRRKKRSDSFEKILRQQKERKFNVLVTKRYKNNQYYNYDYLFNSRHPTLDTVRKQLQQKISCKGKQGWSQLKEQLRTTKKMLWQKHKEAQRNTQPSQPFQRVPKRRHMNTSQYQRDIDISLSPWSELTDQVQN